MPLHIAAVGTKTRGVNYQLETMLLVSSSDGGLSNRN